MKKSPVYWNKAKVYLSKKDKVIKNLINNYKDGHLITRNDVFFSLCKSIIGQQISVAAANSVFLRFKKKLFEISVYDKNKIVKEQKNLLKDHDIKEFFTGDIKFEFIDKKSHIFLSPGVSLAEVNKFNQKFSIINDISLFLEHLSNNSNNLKVIGITGTKTNNN